MKDTSQPLAESTHISSWERHPRQEQRPLRHPGSPEWTTYRPSGSTALHARRVHHGSSACRASRQQGRGQPWPPAAY